MRSPATRFRLYSVIVADSRVSYERNFSPYFRFVTKKNFLIRTNGIPTMESRKSRCQTSVFKATKLAPDIPPVVQSLTNLQKGARYCFYISFFLLFKKSALYGEKYLVGNASHRCLFGFVIVASPVALKIYVYKGAGGKRERPTLFKCPGREKQLWFFVFFFSFREKVVFSVVSTEVNVGQHKSTIFSEIVCMDFFSWHIVLPFRFLLFPMSEKEFWLNFFFCSNLLFPSVLNFPKLEREKTDGEI